MGRYQGLFTREEFTKQVLPNAVRTCRIELLRQGRFGKRGARVDRSALLECVRRKINEEKQKRLSALR